MTNPASVFGPGTARTRALRRGPRQEPPRWPLLALFAGYPLWWILGIGDLAFPLIAVVMAVLLLRGGRVAVPRGFGLWLLFLLWMTFSVIGIDTSGRLIGFVYRALLYLAVTVIFLYVYNARHAITRRSDAGALTVFWFVTVAGGYLGVFVPLLSFATPLSFVLPDSLLANELVREMVYRRVTQYDPTSFLQLEPRPSAPFLYTNGWGNVYSMLTPVVIGYLLEVRGTRRFWLILGALPLSFVPAFLTLNRGMFLGLAVAAGYVAVRALLRGNARAILGLVALGAVVGIVFAALPISERLTDRLETSSTTEDRANLYDETLERTLESPVFGYGAPRPSETDGAPSAGTQGQFWMVLFSHGIPGAALFVAWLVWIAWRTRRERDPVGLAMHTVLLVILVEIFYYGVLVPGLAIAMICSAVLLRGRDPAPLPVHDPPRAPHPIPSP